LYRATEGGDVDVVRALLAKGANPNINGMGFTPFLVAAGVTPGAGGGAAPNSGAPNTALLDLMIEHGADVNTQVTGTKSYSMRVSYNPPPNKEGTTALHGAVQAGRPDLVRYLLKKGAAPGLVDANGRKPVDMLDVPAAAGRVAGPTAAGRGAGGRGGAGVAVDPATAAEIRALLR
jgi:ankyrin repeat protein